MSCEFVPSQASYCAGRIEHLVVLTKLMLCAVVSGRREDAKALYQFIAKTKIPSKELSLFLKFTLEMVDHNGPGSSLDTDVLRTLRSMALKLPAQTVLITEECTSYYAQAAKYSEGYENLVGYLSTSPYSSAPVLFGYAGWLSLKLAEMDRRSAVKEKHLKRALNHFDQYFDLMKNYSIDTIFVRFCIACNTQLNRHKEARKLLDLLCQWFPKNSHIRTFYFDFLLEHFPEEREHIYRVIKEILQIARVAGLFEVSQRLENYITLQLANTHLKLPEHLKYLRLLAELLLIRFGTETAHRGEVMHKISTLEAQFSFCGLRGEFLETIEFFKDLKYLFSANISDSAS